MFYKKSISRLLIFVAAAVSVESFAHGGRLNSSGCHNDRKNGGYHCHSPQHNSATVSNTKPLSSAGSAEGKTVFRNCAEARAAGAAPVFASDPRYGKHLDRDGDGIGCE